MSGIAGAKNSYCTSVKVGNWVEDNAGARLASSLASRHASARLETTDYRSNFTAPPPGAGAKPASAPQPLDQLDGHLVMAHGTDIVHSRHPGAGHFVSVTQATMRGVKPSALVDSQPPVPTRTELMREKAKMRAAGVEPWDPPALYRSALPRVGTTITPPAVGTGMELGRTSDVPLGGRGSTLQGVTMAGTAVASALAPPRAEAAGFGRSGAFSATFKRGVGAGAAL